MIIIENKAILIFFLSQSLADNSFLPYINSQDFLAICGAIDNPFPQNFAATYTLSEYFFNIGS